MFLLSLSLSLSSLHVVVVVVAVIVCVADVAVLLLVDADVIDDVVGCRCCVSVVVTVAVGVLFWLLLTVYWLSMQLWLLASAVFFA